MIPTSQNKIATKINQSVNLKLGFSMSKNVIQTLQDLVRINSVNPAYDGGQSEAAIASYIEGFFRKRGIETWEQEVFEGRPNLIARVAGEQPGDPILFEAHTDTVTASDMENAFEPVILDGLLYGRGACDNKGGLAAMMHALARVQESGKKPLCDIWLAATADEEHSCRGVQRLCKSLKVHSAVVAEPTELRMTIACKGCIRWRIEVHGRESHSSKPDLGCNAIVHMAEVIRAIEKDSQLLRTLSHSLLGSPSCNIGVIRGGTLVNVVPESCIIEIDRRLLPNEKVDEVFSHYKAILDALATKVPTLSYTMEPPMITALPMETSIDAPVAQHSAKILRAMGLSSDPIGVPFSCDASTLSQHGIPCIVFGPGSIDQAHTPDEYVKCAEVEKAIDFYQQMMTSNIVK